MGHAVCAILRKCAANAVRNALTKMRARIGSASREGPRRLKGPSGTRSLLSLPSSRAEGGADARRNAGFRRAPRTCSRPCRLPPSSGAKKRAARQPRSMPAPASRQEPADVLRRGLSGVREQPSTEVVPREPAPVLGFP